MDTFAGTMASLFVGLLLAGVTAGIFLVDRWANANPNSAIVIGITVSVPLAILVIANLIRVSIGFLRGSGKGPRKISEKGASAKPRPPFSAKLFCFGGGKPR